jgi:hypothetical protein
MSRGDGSATTPPTSRIARVAEVLRRSKFAQRSAEEYALIGADLADWLASKVSSARSNLQQVVTHHPPVIDFDLPNGPRVTARDIYLAWLACPQDPASDMLARLGLDAIEERDADTLLRRGLMAINQQPAGDDHSDHEDEWTDTSHLPGPDPATDANYRREIVAYLTRSGRCRPEWRRL